MPDDLFHVMSRATEGQLLFRREADHRRYLGLLQLAAERNGWNLHTFALMPNHVHFLLQAQRERISAGLWFLHSLYAEHYKLSYQPWLGHVFGRRPKMKPIRDEGYYLAVVRYIARNPVGPLVERPEDYRWSAHRALIGVSPRPPMLAADEVLRWFDGASAYERFVTGVEPGDHAAVRRWAGADRCRPDLEMLLADPTPVALIAAYDTWDYSLREIANATGLSRATVHRRIVRARP